MFLARLLITLSVAVSLGLAVTTLVLAAEGALFAMGLLGPVQGITGLEGTAAVVAGGVVFVAVLAAAAALADRR